MKVNIKEESITENINVIFMEALEQGRNAALRYWEGYNGQD